MSHGGNEESRKLIRQLWEAGVVRARRSTGSLVKIQMEAWTMGKELEARPIPLPNERKTCCCEGSCAQSPGKIDDKASLKDSETISYTSKLELGSKIDLDTSFKYSGSPPEDRSFTIGLVVGLTLSRKKVARTDNLQADLTLDSLSTPSETMDSESLDGNYRDIYNYPLDPTSAGQEKHKELSRSDTISICSLD